MNIPNEFYKAEERSGYFVSEKMKKIWAVELDLLSEFIRVCEKNGLNYFLDGGTLLGAVRHGGFIPWDDDADVIMPRKDYDKLWEIAEEEFQYPYFFQTTISEEGFFRTHAQLRNSDTTGFIGIDGTKLQINKGIFIDVFVLDNVPSSKIKKELLKTKIKWHKAVLAYEYDRDFRKISKKSKLFYIFVHMLFKIVPYKKYFEFFNHKVLGKYKNKETELVGDITLKWRENVIWDSSWWNDYSYLEFEGLKCRVPKDYDKVLSRQYGDYMKLPEDVTAPNERSHGEVTFDPDIPYTEFKEN